jgi:hypothetical protein
MTVHILIRTVHTFIFFLQHLYFDSAAVLPFSASCAAESTVLCKKLIMLKTTVLYFSVRLNGKVRIHKILLHGISKFDHSLISLPSPHRAPPCAPGGDAIWRSVLVQLCKTPLQWTAAGFYFFIIFLLLNPVWTTSPQYGPLVFRYLFSFDLTFDFAGIFEFLCWICNRHK